MNRSTGAPENNPEFVYGRQPVWETLQVGKRSLHKLWMSENLSGGVIEKILQAAREHRPRFGPRVEARLPGKATPGDRQY